MMILMKRLIFLPILLFVFGMGTSTVFACSGRSHYYLDKVADSEIVVLGRVVEVDDRDYSAILQVERYLKGRGSTYLALVRHPVALEVISRVRGYDTGCTYNGNGDPILAGSYGYFSLISNGDGTFSDDNSIGGQFLIGADGTVSYTNLDHEEFNLPATDFEEVLRQYLGDDSEDFYPELENSRFPLMRSLMIRTEAGSLYRLNVDYSLTLIPETYPIAISPDGSHLAYRRTNHTFDFTYHYRFADHALNFDAFGYYCPNCESQINLEIEGEAVAFSPNSMAAVWDSQNLSIYLFNNLDMGMYGLIMGVTNLAQINFTDNQASSERILRWSSNSSTIAYQDNKGIWLWNLNNMSEPQLIIQNDANNPLPDLLELSLTGRYLRYGTNSNWILFDTQTNLSYHNVLISPDESTLVYINPEIEESSTQGETAGDLPCQVPLSLSCPTHVIQEGLIHTHFWSRNDTLFLFTCNETECRGREYSWHSSYNLYQYHIWTFPTLRMLSYETESLYFAAILGDYELKVDFIFPTYPGEQMPNIDFSSQLDSPIAHIEWGQPIFYEEH
jgi:hypothetical protein